MKKITLTILTSLLFFNVYSQFMALPGIKAGGNYSNLMGDSRETGKFGFHVGAIAEIQITGNMFFQAEVLYSLQGAKYDIVEETLEYDRKVDLHYLNVPLMAKIYLNGYDDGWFFEVGPQVGFLVFAKETVDGTLNGEPIYEEAKVTDFYSATDLYGSFGVGYKPFDSDFFISARYNLGLTDVDEYEDVDVKARNTVVQLSFGFIFD
ncbi:porin family protein [Abyssalbus ytuae]|uniref:PorT family protein n=1 Tax=Abyssalbus ytuae TaxID=2926907 RepID=A0A9E7CUA2_9FLAO|nr:porin family protein [Abyssalbus ytuae]UOB18027.1 PorT family protein [Abyssalbus ytuae]